MSDNISTGSADARHILQFSDQPMEWLTFLPSGLRINLKTGEVVIPEGMSLSDASRAFWQGLQQAYGVTNADTTQ